VPSRSATGRPGGELDARVIAEGEFRGHVVRPRPSRQRHACRWRQVCGRPGRSPSIRRTSLPQSGYEQVSPPARTTLSVGPADTRADFWMADYRTRACCRPAAGLLVVERRRRVAYAGQPTDAVRAIPGPVQDLHRPRQTADGREARGRPGREFITRFLPEVTRTLFPPDDKQHKDSRAVDRQTHREQARQPQGPRGSWRDADPVRRRVIWFTDTR
jgi:hypothetical protein